MPDQSVPDEENKDTKTTQGSPLERMYEYDSRTYSSCTIEYSISSHR
jgi:hypothetical protein